MIGAITENGTRRIAAKSGTQVSTTISPAMLPRYMLAIRPQTKSGFSTKSSGPGCRPQIISPPMITAAVGEPGTPRVIIGSSAEVPAACAAGPGAHTAPDLPGPELVAVARETARHAVAHERGGRGAARHDPHEAADRRGAQRRKPVARQLLPGVEHHAHVELRLGAAEREPLLE